MTVARTTGLGALTVALAVVLTMGANAQNKPTLGGKLELADEGSFFVNGKSIKSDYPGASAATGPAAPGNIIVNQMYVHYRIPAAAKGVPLVLVHGSNHTGMTYETTPDGREGWATWFVRQGHPVYVVDHSGRGRSGFNPTPVNAARDGGADPKAIPTLFLGPIDRAWWNFRFGPEYPKPFANLQFPLEALDQYLAQLVPNTETTLDGGGEQHHRGAGRAHRQDRPGGGDGALAVGCLRTRAGAPAAEFRPRADQRRGRLRDVRAS